MRKENARQHSIHNRRMVADDNVLSVPVDLLVGKIFQFVAKAHSEKHSVAPKPDKPVRVAVVFFIK